MVNLQTRCQRCEKEYSSWALRACPVCGRQVCRRCETFTYGRTFCSDQCAGYFVHGDSDTAEVDEES